MTDPSTPSAPATSRRGPGRRVALGGVRRLSPLTVLSVLLPLLTLASLALVRPAEAPGGGHEPTSAPLTRASLVCPPPAGDARRLVAGTLAASSGEVTLLARGKERPLGLSPTGARRITRPVAVTGQGDVAPGLVASLGGGDAVAACTVPEPEQWFTGLGAGAEHRSTLVLTNPDRGPAVADVTVFGSNGVLDVPALRGVRVGGGTTVSLDLAEIVPTRDALAIQVLVSRGRLGVHVLDTVDPLGRAKAMQEWLPAQARPDATAYVLGLGTTRGDRVLALANPGDGEVRVETRLVAPTSEFEAAGSEEIRVRPGSVVEVDLTRLLRGKVARDAAGLRLDATGPVTAALRSVVDDDLVLTTASSTVEESSAFALPAGTRSLVVAGASGPGVLTWTARDAAGVALVDAQRVEIDPGTALRLEVPRKAVLVDVMLDRATAHVVVEVGDPLTGVVPLRELETTSLVPHVSPALR